MNVIDSLAVVRRLLLVAKRREQGERGARGSASTAARGFAAPETPSEREARTRRDASATAFASLWAGLFCVLGALLGCSSETTPAVQSEDSLGRVELNLLGQGSAGTLFRLRNAILTVQGPDQTLFFDTESDPDATSLTAIVPPGFYTSFLQEGWFLERVGSPKSSVGAVLLSPNPDGFEVFAGERTRVALRFRVEGDIVVTDPGLLEIAIEVEESPGTAPFCSSDAECAFGETCCVSGFLGTCIPLAPGQACPLPDLTVSAEDAAASLIINREFFPPESCAIAEGCVEAPGTRRLLRFSTVTPNIGEADFVLGDPAGTPGFEFGECHGHFHFEGYARYELIDATGAVAARGHKQAFCLLDSIPIGLPGAPTTPRFHCGFQGLQRGWADIYGAGLDCQWVDITDVPDGDYLLRISINPDGVIVESDFTNNTVEVPVTIAPPPPVNPLAPCAAIELGATRECGWAPAPGFEAATCTPGEVVSLTCGCPSVTCGGDPMLRVCEGTAACGAFDALALVDDSCGLCPQVNFICPSSGAYNVLSSSFALQPFTCDVAPVGSIAPVEPVPGEPPPKVEPPPTVPPPPVPEPAPAPAP